MEFLDLDVPNSNFRFLDKETNVELEISKLISEQETSGHMASHLGSHICINARHQQTLFLSNGPKPWYGHLVVVVRCQTSDPTAPTLWYAKIDPNLEELKPNFEDLIHQYNLLG